MTINEAMRTYRLPNTTTPEELESRWSNVLTFGDKILLAGFFYPHYFAATYAFTSDDHSCEGEIRLKAASDPIFEDDGHAISWAIAN